MKDDSLGLNHFVVGSATCHAVTPLSSALSSAHLRAQPPHASSSIPRCFLYHSRRALSSVFALTNTPPIPVIFAIVEAPFIFFTEKTNSRSKCGWTSLVQPGLKVRI